MRGFKYNYFWIGILPLWSADANPIFGYILPANSLHYAPPALAQHKIA